MLIEKINGFKVYLKKNGHEMLYRKILLDYFNHSLVVGTIFKDSQETKVFLIDGGGGQKFILKVFIPQKNKIERFLKSFFKGDYYLNLFCETERVQQNGVYSICDFYLLAEKKFCNYSSIFIMLFEYIEGESLGNLNLDSNLKERIKQEVLRLHKNNMVMGDIQTSNFILAADKIRIIDCSGKRASLKRKAEDRINLQRRFGIQNCKKDYGYFVVIAKERVRKVIRKIKNFLAFF